MHASYCESRNLELPLNGCTERQWNDALKMGMSPDDVRLVIKVRKERIKAGVRHEECLKIRNIAGSEDAIAEALEEVAAAKAKLRVKVFSAGKREVLKATGRMDEPEQSSARPISEYLATLRNAAQ